MRIQGTPLDTLTWNDVIDFCSQQFPENTVLDYKREIPGDIEKTVAAMANTLGGMILIGVAEDGHAKPVSPPVGIAGSRGIVEQVMSKCIDNITPLIVPEVVECLNPTGDRAIVVVRVSPSPDAPHAINRNTMVYIRTGRQSDPEELASIDRLEWIIKRREKSEAFREWLIERASARYNLLRAGRVPGISASREQNAERCLLTLSICPFYPDAEPLLRAPDMLAVRREISVRDPMGTAHNFPIDEGVSPRSVEDGIIMHIPGGDGLRTYHTHLNMHGLYFYKQSLLWTPERRHQVGDQQPPVMRLVEIVARLYSLLFSAEKFYRKIGYVGPLAIHLKLENFERVALAASNLIDSDYTTRYSADQLIQARAMATTYDLPKKRDEIVLALAQRIAWAFDCDLSVEQLSTYANFAFKA